MPQPNAISFRPGPELGPLIDGRGEQAGLVAKRDLERYYHLLDHELRRINLTEGEAMLLCDACNGLIFEPYSIPLLWANVDDAIRLDGLDAKWHVDGPELVAKLRALTRGQAFAVVDAIERFWREPNAEGQMRAVGLSP